MKQDIHNDYISAAAAVYAWMSAADGEITKSEVDGFVKYLNSLPYVSEISISDFDKVYLDFLSAFEVDYEGAVRKSQYIIEAFKGDFEKSEDLLRVARSCLVADGKLFESEELVLKDIADLLGVVEEEISFMSSASDTGLSKTNGENTMQKIS